MSFKLNNPPYEDNKVKVYKVPMEEGVLGKANNMASSNEGFSIHINQKVNSTPKYNEVVDHENGHIDQMNRGDLAYDDDKVVWKGKEHTRENMPEGDHDLEWEKEIYDEQQNNSPMAFKLRKGQGNNTPFANLANRGLIKPAPLKNKVDYNHDGNNTNDGNNVGETETEAEKKARLAKEAEENANNNMQVVNTTVNTLEDGTIQTIEDLEGEGEAEGYHVGKEKMGNEEWKAWLKTPEGQKYTASKKLKDQNRTFVPDDKPDPGIEITTTENPRPEYKPKAQDYIAGEGDKVFVPQETQRAMKLSKALTGKADSFGFKNVKGKKLQKLKDEHDEKVLASRAKQGKMGAETLTIAEQEAKESVNQKGAGRSSIVDTKSGEGLKKGEIAMKDAQGNMMYVNRKKGTSRPASPENDIKTEIKKDKVVNASTIDGRDVVVETKGFNSKV